jgi:hypothetical protein
VIVEPTQGLVTVLLPGAKTAIPLPDAERIPVGSIVDATRGRVRLTTVGAGGKLQSADFFGGKFLIAQAPGAKPMVDLKLRGGSFKACPSLKHTSKGARGAAKRKNKAAPSTSIRHLWGEGAGLFRTEGRYASATIRGTTWLTDDRCDGTLVRVTKGAVTVRDVSKRKSLALKAPKQYLARAG